MTSDLHDEFLVALPGGEWSDVDIIRDSLGMMATRAVRARARWVRKDRLVFLKCIRVAKRDAGPETQLLGNRERLAKLKQRLELARASGGPLVPIHHLDWLSSDSSWLLIAMDTVTTVGARIDEGTAGVDLAVRVLRDLEQAKCGKWFHFDICPDNTGVLSNSSVRFIDPESYMRIAGDAADVSAGAHKFWRVGDAVMDQLTIRGTDVDAAAAVLKHDCEVLLLAAECCMGRFPHNEFSADTIDQWCTNSPGTLGKFWLPILIDACAAKPASPAAVASSLESYQESAAVVSVGYGATPAVPGAGSQNIVDQEETNWTDLATWRARMRSHSLTPDELLQYRKALWRGAEREPMKREWWLELLSLCLAFFVDPDMAVLVAERALRFHPNDKLFTYDWLLAKRWPR